MHRVEEVISFFNRELNDSFSTQEKRQLAKLFLMQYLQCDSTELILRNRNIVEKEIMDRITTAIKKINLGEPVQYVLGTTYFYGLTIQTDTRALIPRPETEELVQWVVDSCLTKKLNILDVGTGTGCIPLALKSKLAQSEIVGVDISSDSIALAKENARSLSLEVRFDVADGLELHKYSQNKWDIIVSNPPYIPLADRQSMQKHVVDYEPETALFVQDDVPLIFYEKIGKYAINSLDKKGYLFFEIHEKFANRVVELLTAIGFNSVEIREDLQGKERMLRARL